MKKEQSLLVAGVLVAALLVAGSSGLYEPVGADSVRGKDIDTTSTAPANILEGVPAVDPGKRPPVREVSVERRVEPPRIDAPPDSVLPWIRPVPHPGLGPAHWATLREPMDPVKRPEVKKEETGAAPANGDPADDDPAAAAAKLAEEERKKKEEEDRQRVADAAKFVRLDGSERPCRLTPLGDLEGTAEPWKLIEQWPRVLFRVEELDATTAKKPIGRYEIGADNIADYLTIHLEKTLENQYHEERVRRALKDNDRQGQIGFAQWVVQNLAPRWGVPAIRLAIGNLRLAMAQGMDASLALLLGETCRAAYDPETEIQTYLDYLTGPRANDATILVALGDAYERGGALHAARDSYAKGAGANDVEARLRLGAVMIRLADHPTALRAAHDEFAKAQGAPNPADKARALAGMAQARLAEGRVDEALALARQAKQADGTTYSVHAVLGACLYVKGVYAEAEAAFATSSAMERGGATRGRTNRAFALCALDRIQDAVAECDAALKTDALNWLDPLIGIGEAHQRWSDLQPSNDAFLTAHQRHPRSPWVLLRLAAIRLRDGLPQQSLDILLGTPEKAGLLQIAPESVDALRLAGLACAALDPPDRKRAIEFLRRALQKEPRNADLVYDLCRVLHAAWRAADSAARAAEGAAKSEEAANPEEARKKKLEAAVLTEEAAALRREVEQILGKATDPTSGFANKDARVLALRAFVEFDADAKASFDEVMDALNRAQRAIQDPRWTKDWIEETRETVRTWDRTREVVDEFERAPSEKVGNRWIEDDARQQVGISLDGKHAKFNTGRSGATAAENRQGTSLKRDESLETFVEAEFTLQADPGFEFVCHLWTGNDLPIKGTSGGRAARGRGAEVGFGRDRNGRMTFWVYGNHDKLLEVPVLDASGQPRAYPEDGAYHVIRIARVEVEGVPVTEGRFGIWFDGEPMLPSPGPDGKVEPIAVGALSPKRGSNCSLGVHVDAESGAPVQLLLDRVRIVRRLR